MTSYRKTSMTTGQHRDEAARLAQQAGDLIKHDQNEAAQAYGTLALAHATIAQADVVSAVAHHLEQLAKARRP